MVPKHSKSQQSMLINVVLSTKLVITFPKRACFEFITSEIYDSCQQPSYQPVHTYTAKLFPLTQDQLII